MSTEKYAHRLQKNFPKFVTKSSLLINIVSVMGVSVDKDEYATSLNTLLHSCFHPRRFAHRGYSFTSSNSQRIEKARNSLQVRISFALTRP